MSKPVLVLVDGSAYLYRAFHALPALTNSHGQPTGAIHGALNMLRRLIKDYAPDYMAVVFDTRAKTFRDDLYPQYKANRESMPDELAAQITPLHELIRAMGLPLLAVDGVEADDVMGTLAQQAHAAGMYTLIATGDKDMAQLVNDDIVLVNTMDNSRLDPAGVLAKFGVRPPQMVDYLTLVGDTSDNVPGVPKVGAKTAAKWLSEYHTLDNVVAHAGEISGKVGENLRASLAQLPLSKKLVTIKGDVTDLPAPQSLIRTPPDKNALRECYTRLEFKTLLNKLLRGDAAEPAAEKLPTAAADKPARTQTQRTPASGSAVPVGEPPAPLLPAIPTQYDCVLSTGQFNQWLEKLREAPLFAFDTETTALDYMRARVVGVSFAVTAGEAAYVPLMHDYPGAPEQLDRDWVLAQLKPLLEDAARAKVGQHSKYDANVLRHHGITLAGIAHDTMLQSYVLDATATRHDMDSLALKYLGHRTIHFADIAGKGAKQLHFNDIALEQAAPYAAEDADITLRLHETLYPRLAANAGLQQVYEQIEIPLIPVLAKMEQTGVMIDSAMLAQQSSELAKRMQEVEAQAYGQAGQPFNISSPKQLGDILFTKLGITPLEKTPTGQPSTSESVLSDLAHEHPLAGLILEYRSLSKLKSTYTDTLPQQVCAQTGRVHTSYHQAVAATGRLSSSDPNLQNIPIRTAEGRRIRQAFIAPRGYVLLAADYSQIELRIMAHLSQDAALIGAFARGEDIHRATAAEVFAVPLAGVSDEQRRAAKAINFGLIYGMSAFGLAKQLGIERHAAQQYVDLYFARYPGVRAYMERTRAQARTLGYVETLFGRRLTLPDIQERNAARRQYAERTAINAPMQGTAADIIKRAMIAVDAWLPASGCDARMIMQVHDELVLEVAEAAVAEVGAQVRVRMSAAAVLAVPLVVDIGSGANWDEAH